MRVGGWEGWLRCDVGGAVLQDGQQPLHWALAGGHVDMASVLIEKGAAVDVADRVSGAGCAIGSGGHMRQTERPCHCGEGTMEEGRQGGTAERQKEQCAVLGGESGMAMMWMG